MSFLTRTRLSSSCAPSRNLPQLVFLGLAPRIPHRIINRTLTDRLGLHPSPLSPESEPVLQGLCLSTYVSAYTLPRGRKEVTWLTAGAGQRPSLGRLLPLTALRKCLSSGWDLESPATLPSWMVLWTRRAAQSPPWRDGGRPCSVAPGSGGCHPPAVPTYTTEFAAQRTE